MRFIDDPVIETLYKEPRVILKIDNRYRGDIIKQLKKINGLDADYSLEIKKKRGETEKTAQGYIWQLINLIAEKKSRQPVSLYREYVSKIMPKVTVRFESLREAARSKEEWENQGVGWIVLDITDYKDYVRCVRVRGYSGWDYQEVDKFIDYLEKECRNLGVNINGGVDKNT